MEGVPAGELVTALAVIAYIELRVTRTVAAAVDALEAARERRRASDLEAEGRYESNGRSWRWPRRRL